MPVFWDDTKQPLDLKKQPMTQHPPEGYEWANGKPRIASDGTNQGFDGVDYANPFNQHSPRYLRKKETQHPPHTHCDHEVVCRHHFPSDYMVGIPCKDKCAYDTRIHTAPASHQRIEQVIKELERLKVGEDRHTADCYDLAIALLREGDKS